MEEGVRRILSGLEVDLNDPNFIDTPMRVAKMWKDHLAPYPDWVVFPHIGRGGILLLKDHICWGFCPHHLLPVRYEFKIAYLPEDRVVGLSKLARLADYFATQLLIQEDIAPAITQDIEYNLKPIGTAVLITGEHMCTRIRGVRSPCVTTVTDCFSGAFLEEASARAEFLSL